MTKIYLANTIGESVRRLERATVCLHVFCKGKKARPFVELINAKCENMVKAIELDEETNE